ncbi:MAG: hypothetical protein NC413_01610 [Muribaculum sp.]|nr:hypothetical protein [Muribaculum sp.]
MKLRNSNAADFIKNLNGRKVICFGAGSSLAEREQISGEFDSLEEHIAFLVDNDMAKQGSKYLFKNHSYDIRSPETLKQIDAKDYVLMITCMYYVEMFLLQRPAAGLGGRQPMPSLVKEQLLLLMGGTGQNWQKPF